MSEANVEAANSRPLPCGSHSYRAGVYALASDRRCKTLRETPPSPSCTDAARSGDDRPDGDSAPIAPQIEPQNAYQRFGKRALDIALLALGAPIALVLIGVAILALRIEGGSPFYRQVRLGRGGRMFHILKLRTMVEDADSLLEQCLAADPARRAEWDSTQKLKSDPRITRVGAFLRATSLDELPQLWNVAKGEMSLVGPRPMMPEQLPLYGDPRYYVALRPGITGPWQVSQRNDAAFCTRNVLDAEYCRTLSLMGDARILLATVGAVLNRTGY